VKQIKTILIAILLTLTAQAGWKPLKSLDHYGPKAFTLKKGVSYVEVRKYVTANSGYGAKSTKKKEVALQMYRHPLSYFGSATKRSFQNLPAREKYAFKKGSYASLGPSQSWYYNGFMLDSHGKQWRLENITDVVEMVKPIDSPAKLSLSLWLHSDAQNRADKGSYGAKYRKSGKGYVVQEHHIAYGGGDWIYACGDYTFEYRINRSGKITQKKLLRKKAVECGGD